MIPLTSNVILLLLRSMVKPEVDPTARVTESSELSLPESFIFSSVTTLPPDAVKS